MAIPSSSPASASRPMVQALFVSTVLLSIVSWYTTYQGMALYLNNWFAFIASLGIQSALVLVAWLIGFTLTRRPLLTAVYAITAIVSIAFSYVSLYTWFSARERPAIVQRQLYDTITDSAGKTDQLLANGITEARKHVLALDEMTTAEKSHGFISRAQDADPYLGRIRESVAREAQTYSTGYKEGTGEGLRYTAFDRYSKLTRQSLEQLITSQKALADFRAQLKPSDPSDQQIRRYREVYDAIPWTELEGQLHSARLERPPVPTLSGNLDKTASGQEELLLGFTELVTAPTGRHIFAFLLAAFIDVIVFLLAFASGPHFFGAPELRWSAASAALDGADAQVFTRDFLRKFEPDRGGLARIPLSSLTPGERQFLLILASHQQASLVDDHYLIDELVHQQLVESLATRSIPLRSPRFATAGNQ